MPDPIGRCVGEQLPRIVEGTERGANTNTAG